MKKNVFNASVFIIGVLACNTNSVDNSENHNIMGKKAGATKEISSPEHNHLQEKFSAEVLKLNKQATLLINDGNEKKYLEAIRILDKAISLDKTYYMAYSNKAIILTRLGKYTEAIDVYNHLVKNVKPDYPEALTMLGMLYDKIGEKFKAKEYYQKAIQKYSNRISEKEDVLDMVNRAHLIFILDNEKGLSAMDSLIKVYSTNEELPMYKEYMFIKYNHQKALDDL